MVSFVAIFSFTLLLMTLRTVDCIDSSFVNEWFVTPDEEAGAGAGVGDSVEAVTAEEEEGY